MPSKVEVVANMTSPGYTAFFSFDELTKTLILDTLAEVPKLVAQKIVQDHFKEIMDALSVNEVTTLIAAAVAQKVADAYKPKEETHAVPEQADVERSDH